MLLLERVPLSYLNRLYRGEGNSRLLRNEYTFVLDHSNMIWALELLMLEDKIVGILMELLWEIAYLLLRGISCEILR